jgi:hypothetical protein
VEYQRIGAWWHGLFVSTDALFFLWEERVSWNADGSGCWVVFGTLLGPEATGPGFFPLGEGSGVCLFLVSWLHRSHGCPFGGVCGVCGLGLLFENYIVDASIFYKKQFPRI